MSIFTCNHHHEAARAMIAYRLDPCDVTLERMMRAFSAVLNWSSCQVGEPGGRRDERLVKLMQADDYIHRAMSDEKE